MTATDPRLQSIRYPIAIDGGAGRLAQQPDYATHVEELIMQVLYTTPGERINRPDFGCGLRRMVFEPNSPEVAQLVQVTVMQALEKWLDALITVDRVRVTSVSERLELELVYRLDARGERRYLNLEVTP